MLLCAKRAVSQNRAFPAVQEIDVECEVVYFHFFFTGNLIPALFLLDWAIHAMLEADVRA